MPTVPSYMNFCDASIHGIAAVCYLKSTHPDGKINVSFVFGKAKLAPSHATTIPRLELCAGVLAVEITELVIGEQAFKPDSVTYYCIVLYCIVLYCIETLFKHGKLVRIYKEITIHKVYIFT